MDTGIYTDIEKALLQFIISVGTIGEEFAEAVHVKLKADYQNEALAEHLATLKERSLETSIDLINIKLHFLGYEITKIRSQESQELFYVYVNTFNDTPSKISTNHTPKEIEIIKKIIDKIITDNDEVESYVISSKDALGYCRLEGFTATQGISFLKKLVNEGWFNLSKNGKYSLSIRTLAELKRTLIDKYGTKSFNNDEGDINICVGCNEIVTLGIRCSNTWCNARFHKQCQIHYAKAKGTKCPNDKCDVDWSEISPLIVGEHALNSKIANY